MSERELPAGAGPVDGQVRPDQRRAAFEKFAQNCPTGRYSIDRETRPGRDGDYWSSHTQIMWDAWKAALRCQQEDVDTVAEHSGKTKDREWHSAGCWLRPGDVLAHMSKPKA